MANSPFIRDVPAAQALEAWRAAREAAGCPERLPAIEVADHRGGGAGHRRAGLGHPVLAAVRRGRAWTASRSARRTPSARARPRPRTWLPPGAYDVVDTGDPMPAGRDAVVMREHVHYDDRAGPSCAPPSRPTSTSAPSARTSAPASCCCRRGTGCGPSTWRRRRPPGQRSCPSGSSPLVLILPTGDEVRADRDGARAGADPRHQLADARGAGAARPGAMRGACRSSRTTRSGSRPWSRRRRRSATC